jgi:tetratricopeptide (TPR) repeat protein
MTGTLRVFITGLAVAAAFAYLQAAPLSDSDAQLQIQLATRLFDEARYAEAFDAFDDALSTDDPALAQRARKGKVRAALRIAEFSVARREGETLKTSAGSDPEIVALYGDSLWAMGLFDEAEEQYRAALAFNGESSRARLGVARSLATRSRLPEALEEALRARAADSRDYQIHATLGDIYTRLHRFDDAANSFAEYKGLLSASEVASAVISEGQIKFLRSFKGRSPLAISDEAAAAVHTVPFRLSKNKVLVRAVINGR